MTKTKTNKTTELVFILDKSGSMTGMEADTIGGFNSMIKKQKDSKVNALVTTILFDDKAKVIHDRVKIDEVPQMTSEDYFASGCTALLDAVGSAIKHISTIHQYARKEDKPQKTLFVITTDGYENSSKTYNFRRLKTMITNKREKDNWEFLFLGANIDAIEEASKLGIGREYAANVINDEKGTNILYQEVASAVKCCCCESDTVPVIPRNWKSKIEADYKKRNSKK